MAKDARRVDVLCYRIYLSYRLLHGTSKFNELHEIVKEAKSQLETEVGPVNGVSAKMARGIVSRLSIAGDVLKLCSLAIQKADEWLANVSNADQNSRGRKLYHLVLLFSPFTGHCLCLENCNDYLFVSVPHLQRVHFLQHASLFFKKWHHPLL